MRKLISIVLTLVLVFGLTTLTVSAADPMIAGNEVIDRLIGPDGWSNFYLADGNNVFAEDSIMTGFSVYIKALNPFNFMVFKEVEDEVTETIIMEIIYESERIDPTEEDLGVYTVELDSAVFVPEGSLVGLFYPGKGAVPYSETTTGFGYDDINSLVLFTGPNEGPGLEGESPELIEFYNSDDRVYSIQALGFAAPASGWLSPISKESYKMNYRSTLPIKFRLEGEFEDVKLMVNDVEVPIELKECEEDGDFYMGLFRPTAPGEYTATVLVNGAPVLMKEFTAFDNAAKVKAQEKVKVIKGLAKGKDK